jgi:hypothetical protein
VVNTKRERAKSRVAEEIKSVLEIEHKSVVNGELYFNIALVLTPPASHNF